MRLFILSLTMTLFIFTQIKAEEAQFRTGVPNNKIVQLERERDRLQLEVEALQIQFEKVDEQLDKAVQTTQLALNSTIRTVKKPKTNDKEKVYDPIPSSYEYLIKEVQNVNRRRENIEAKIADKVAKIKTLSQQVQLMSENNQDELNQKLMAEIRTMKLTHSYSELKHATDLLAGQAEGFDRDIDMIEKTLDDSLLAVYVQEKIGQLLNSQVMCTATRRRCGSGNDVQVPIAADVIQNELFPESVVHRSEYYEKMSKRKPAAESKK